MEIPTARVLRENRYRLGAGQVEPYRYFYGAISPLKGLEIDGRITEVLDVPALSESYGNYKDKAVDLKYQFIPEGKYLPALAIGIMDPHGTRIYPSQYIVASKQIFPFDLTLGFGNGRFGTEPLKAETDGIKVEMFDDPAEWLRDSQFFWGIQFAPSERYALMFEYSPIRYQIQTDDPAQPKHFRQAVPSKFNFGMRIRPTTWMDIDISYQRGNRFGFNISTAFDIGDPLIPIYDPPYHERPADRLSPLQGRLTAALANTGFSSIGTLINGNDLWITAQNDRYLFTARALGSILKTVHTIDPENIERVHIVLTERGIPLVVFIAEKADILDLYENKLTTGEFYSLSEVKTDPSGIPDMTLNNRKAVTYGLKPSLETFLNDPSGFFRYRFGVSAWATYQPTDGLSLIGGISTYPLNNITTTNEPLSIPVRSDIVPYKEQNFALSRLMFDQITRVSPGVFGKLSGGLLEIEYAGFDAECAMPLLDGRVLVGISGSAVKKRDPDDIFRLKSDDVKDVYTTAFLNARLNIAELEMSVDIKAGRFLAGDTGARFTISKFIKGVKIWAWYSVTDTSVFSDSFNDGYHDKGIGVTIPIRLFMGKDSRTSYDYTLSPWTRDTGQDIDHFTTLFDFIGRNTKLFLEKDRKEIY